ncbi:restriction endonuclease [candidate division WOR-1 bacterium RIFCSPLOWO2_02_FULL_46_20]|uniref:Restriction endonuclease n=1 Tax=candidate division WOR-1 bacterium RIFCSPLOWO2_02_FULL_46_20 TaxID=1802567 RepID=A0A1F4RCJ2_UNCSA|nr:MAG: restriction endonuclease [candidate division WOR-1 bacterium RIFCSPHIGHO2_02_FULL_45_12]OGC05899.1 MAG: restriction endonuclease [candidate division WOR-1 bacterium RIFCSPLOWO2_02_FULL_46_20]
MAINANKPALWKKDIAESVDYYNKWFIKFAPKTFRITRKDTSNTVLETFKLTSNLQKLTPAILKKHPSIIQTLRMSTCPPIARDRLVGLTSIAKHLILSMEEGKLPPQMKGKVLDEYLNRICSIICKLIDSDIIPWLEEDRTPDAHECERASTIIADRLCGAVADPIIRNAQEQRQLMNILKYLEKLGYKYLSPSEITDWQNMKKGTFTFRLNISVGNKHKVNIPIDVVIMPNKAGANQYPILIEAKSAGDFTNTNKRRKEEATKIRQLKDTYGAKINFMLFLCGYFDSGYLGYEAAEGIDWIWEHRIDDMIKLGL